MNDSDAISKALRQAKLVAVGDWKALAPKRPLNVAVVGSRVTSQEMRRAVKLFIDGLPDGWSIVSGGAKGVDTLAQRAAEARDMHVEVFKPNWKRWGKSAGFRRNRTIVEASDMVVAFWDGVSAGTESSIRIAKDLGKPLIVKVF